MGFLIRRRLFYYVVIGNGRYLEEDRKVAASSLKRKGGKECWEHGTMQWKKTRKQ